ASHRPWANARPRNGPPRKPLPSGPRASPLSQLLSTVSFTTPFALTPGPWMLRLRFVVLPTAGGRSLTLTFLLRVAPAGSCRATHALPITLTRSAGPVAQNETLPPAAPLFFASIVKATNLRPAPTVIAL